jgi:hypothetical protein
MGTADACTMTKASSAVGTRGSAGSRAGWSSAAGTGARCCSRSPLLQPGKFTELFFLDEATAFAAGHRPCALCRREDYVRFTTIWRSMHPAQVGADAMDAQLHAERVDPATRGQRRHASSIAGLPDGAFVVDGQDAYLVVGERMLRWTPSGYVAGRSRPRRGHVTLLTPPSLVGILRTGWRSAVPLLHPSVRDPRPE